MRVLGAIAYFNLLWLIACLLASKEDEEFCLILLHSAAEIFLSLIGETPGVKLTICGDSAAIFAALNKLFPPTFRINCYFHFASENLRNWSMHLSGDTTSKDADKGTRKL